MAAEQIFITPDERRQAMLDAIGHAREQLVLSLFRCNDAGVLDALEQSVARGVKVQAILTRRAKGGRKPLQKLWDALEQAGAMVHWYADPVVKYHAKYLVADDRLALVATLNPTKKCFSRTWDFILTTDDRQVVRTLATLFELDAAGGQLLPKHRISDRLIIGPEQARGQVRALIEKARRSIEILDPKLSDPDIVSLLRERREAGVTVTVIGRQELGPLIPHGKLMIFDGTVAMLGSMAMSTLSLDFRREVAITVSDRATVDALTNFYRELSERAGESALLLPGDRAA